MDTDKKGSSEQGWLGDVHSTRLSVATLCFFHFVLSLFSYLLERFQVELDWTRQANRQVSKESKARASLAVPAVSSICLTAAFGTRQRTRSVDHLATDRLARPLCRFQGAGVSRPSRCHPARNARVAMGALAVLAGCSSGLAAMGLLSFIQSGAVAGDGQWPRFAQARDRSPGSWDLPSSTAVWWG
jgi:hypothetical protein